MDLPTVSGQVLLLCSLALTGLLAARAIGREYPLICVLTGFAFGQALPWLALDTGIRASNFADIIFYLLLPPLIFQAGWQLEARLLRRWAALILLLAVPGLVLTTGIGGALLYISIDHPTGFPVIAALLTACLLAPTDPGTVITQLRNAHAPPELEVVMESESLFNDATAVVLFGVLLSLALGTATGPGVVPSALLSFGFKFGGGLLVGGACGAVVALLLRISRDHPVGQIVLLLAVFGSFYLAEHIAHVSGVMAVLACALLARRFADSPAAQQRDTASTLGWLDRLCTALLFTLMGLAFEPDMLTERWLAILLGIVAVLVARLLAVYLSLLSARGLGTETLPLASAPVLIVGGLRGAVTVALALSIPVTLDYWWTAQSIAFGVVLFSLFIQGPLNGLILRRTTLNLARR